MTRPAIDASDASSVSTTMHAVALICRGIAGLLVIGALLGG